MPLMVGSCTEEGGEDFENFLQAITTRNKYELFFLALVRRSFGQPFKQLQVVSIPLLSMHGASFTLLTV